MTAADRLATESGAKPAPLRLAVRRLGLSQFRCYDSVRLDLGPAPVVLSGPNGAGKTALLEALSYLSPGQGLRRARLAEVTRLGQGEPWAVSARLDGPEGVSEIGTGLAPAADRDDQESRAARQVERRVERRIVRIDGKPAAGPGELAERVALLWLTPPMDRLFQEGAPGRRRFLDRLVLGLDPRHARQAAAYEKAMRERTRLLKEPGQADRRWLGALEERMAAAGVAVAAARLSTLTRLEQALEAGDGPFPAALLALEGTLEGALETMPATAVEERFRAGLADGRSRDREAGQTLSGPHRSDLRVRHAAKGLAAGLCSTGEQKALLIAIVLANARLQAAERGMVPLLLLDEVAAHLDAAHRAALFAALAELGTQAWMTGTDRALFAAMPGEVQFLTVRDGRLDSVAAHARIE